MKLHLEHGENVKHCMKMGKKFGFRILQFNAVVKSNAGALKLYEKLGFVRLGTIPLFCRPGRMCGRGGREIGRAHV